MILTIVTEDGKLYDLTNNKYIYSLINNKEINQCK